jgi:hypothetical protein
MLGDRDGCFVRRLHGVYVTGDVKYADDDHEDAANGDEKLTLPFLAEKGKEIVHVY